jgi:hypothetical protein
MTGDDLVRRDSQRAEILRRLESGPATNRELNPIANRFGARLKELRDSGRHITIRRIGPGLYEYTLHGPGGGHDAPRS